IFGPSETLQKLGVMLTNETKPKFLYKYNSSETKDEIFVCVYEEHHILLNTNICLTCILEYSKKSTKVVLLSTGGKTGFSGGFTDDDPSIVTKVTDYILDFTKRFGLTIKEDQEAAKEVNTAS
ncbi:MAG: hypothetical protein WED82_08430, partial [Balneolales bacterium]